MVGIVNCTHIILGHFVKVRNVVRFWNDHRTRKKPNYKTVCTTSSQLILEILECKKLLWIAS